MKKIITPTPKSSIYNIVYNVLAILRGKPWKIIGVLTLPYPILHTENSDIGDDTVISGR